MVPDSHEVSASTGDGVIKALITLVDIVGLRKVGVIHAVKQQESQFAMEHYRSCYCGEMFSIVEQYDDLNAPFAAHCDAVPKIVCKTCQIIVEDKAS